MKTKIYLVFTLVLSMHAMGQTHGNARYGDSALQQLTSGLHNTAVGSAALWQMSQGLGNTAVGSSALRANRTGNYNSAFGFYALAGNLGSNNTAFGASALRWNLNGSWNTAVGQEALFSAATSYNTAVGFRALAFNSTGERNTAVGHSALMGEQSGDYNTAVGALAMHNPAGTENSALGLQAMAEARNVSNNTAIGSRALYSTTGSHNIAVGALSLARHSTGEGNIAIGCQALYTLVTGSFNIGIGIGVGLQRRFDECTFIGDRAFNLNADVRNSTAIGTTTVVTASNQIRIGTGATSIGGFVGWSTLSDGRVKENVKEDVPGLALINKLRPVTYLVNTDPLMQSRKANYEADSNVALRRQTGFIAQEAEKAAHDLQFEFSGIDSPKNEKDFYALRYAEFVVPLVKAVQELKQLVTTQRQKIEELEKLIPQQADKPAPKMN